MNASNKADGQDASANEDSVDAQNEDEANAVDKVAHNTHSDDNGKHNANNAADGESSVGDRI